MIKNRITHTASTELLSLLRCNGHAALPKSSCTLLKTQRCVLTEKKCGGEYIYLGLSNGISQTFRENPLLPVEKNIIFLLVNIDGVPLHKSSNSQFWPTLCQLSKFTPFIVAIFYGSQKLTNLNDFLHDFLIEFANLKACGYNKDGVNLLVEIRAFICDAPARQYLKCVKGHTGYFSCERCEIKGKYESFRMILNTTNCVLPTNKLFKQYFYANTHQISRSILIDFNVNYVDGFVLDYMHLVCLGVVKRILIFLTEGPFPYRLGSAQLLNISENLLKLSGKFPSEFARQSRSLHEVKRWKATEFRQFLLYTGFFVLKDAFTPERYQHFLSLTLAMRIFLDSNVIVRNNHLQYAKDLLNYFVVKSEEFYGPTFSVYNVHSLTHLHEDVSFFNCSLDEISSFQFENYLQVIKKFIRKPQSPLSQVLKRFSELENLEISCNQYAKSHRVIFSPKFKDSWFLLYTGEFAQIIGKLDNDQFNCVVLKNCVYKSAFTDPCDSKIFNIVFVRDIKTHLKHVCLSKKHFQRKAVCLDYKEGFVLSCLCHDI